MFTGIVHHYGTINHVDEKGLSIQSCFQNFCIGESIAIDGACLSLTKVEKAQKAKNDIFYFDISKETFNKTIICQYKKESLVNLERALRLGDAMGGHWVTGHIDTLLKVKEIVSQDGCKYIRFSYLDLGHLSIIDQKKYIISKGSICINGVSLTINNTFDDGFDVMIIPQTLKITTLDFLKNQQSVNVEYDTMAKMIAHQYQIYNREIL